MRAEAAVREQQDASSQATSTTSSSKRGQVIFERVFKRYGKVTAVRDVSFQIDSGTLVTLLGPSGCGKTTTLRMIAGLELPSEGRILIGGTDVTRLPATERDVGMVFQSYALFPHLSVLDNVCYGLLSSGQKKRDAEARATQMLANVGLAGMERRLPSELSGGQQQRVALARALVLEPEVLLFDEPLSNLDAKLRRRMREEIRELQQRLGLTAVYVTHDQDEALSVSDKIIVMDKSVIVQEGTPRELYERPRTMFVARFMGDATVLTARMRHVPASNESELLFGDVPVRVPRSELPEGTVSVAVRPHAVALARKTAATGAAAGLDGKIEKRAYLGEHVEYTVETSAGSIFVVSSETAAPFEVGEAVRVTFRPEAGVAVLPPETV